MASPVMTPPPPPARRPRSIAGPVILILLGILFLCGTMGILDIRSIGYYFARFWPALLILWGVIKLIEHEQAKRAGLPGRGIGAGGVFLVLFLIVAGLTATQTLRWWPEIRDNIRIDGDDELDEIFGGSAYNYSDDLSQDFPAGGTLHINNDRGSVTVNASDEKALKISVRKKIHADRQADADNYNNQTKPQITVSDKIVTVNANTQGAGDKGVATDMDVYVPKGTALVITSKKGDVTISGMTANADITHQGGGVDISEHTGNTTLNLERSAARLGRIKGDVTIQGKAKEVSVEDVDGTVHLNGEFQESVRLVRITKTVSFRSSRTDMEFSRLDGRLDLDSGDLRADSLIGPMRLITRSKDISLDGLSGDLRLEDNNATVDVSLHKPGNIQIQNRKGDVQVTIPPNTAITVEARAREGEIESEFDQLKVENSDRQSSATGSIGSNGPHLVINNENGTIGIRKGAVPAPPAPPAAPTKQTKPGKALPAPPAEPVESEN
jgi:putative adhesin/cell wall-active antibiotic response 4TMS protein YvqF